MPKTIGRPMKYKQFLLILEDQEIYTPATIVRFGRSKQLFDPDLGEAASKKAGLKIRHTLARLSTNRQFPHQGDGWVSIRGQPPLRGWFGWRWKETINR